MPRTRRQRSERPRLEEKTRLLSRLLVSLVGWEDTVRTAERGRVDAVVASGIVQAWQRLEIDIPHPAHQWAAGHDIAPSDAKAIAVFAAERPFREQALTAVPALPWHQVPAYLLALGLPSGDPQRRRVGRSFDRVRRGARAVVGRAPVR